jgi:hypothetical protein
LKAFGGESYIRHRILVRVVQDVVQNVHGCLRLDRNTGTDTETVDVLDELFRVGLLVAGGLGRFGSGGIDGGFVVEAVQVAASLLEILDPFLRLLESVSRCVSFVFFVLLCRPLLPRKSFFLSSPYLGDHHVAVEGALSVGFSGPVDVGTNLGDDGRAKGDVWHEVAVHDIHV